MVDLSRIVSVVQIESVRLCEARCRSLVRPDETAETIRVEASHTATVVGEPGGDEAFRVHVAFTLEVQEQSDEKELQAEVRGTFELSYRLPEDERFSSEELAAFGRINGVFNAWPYWRELVHASLARMDMPTLTVPVFRLPPPDTAKDAPEDGPEQDRE